MRSPWVILAVPVLALACTTPGTDPTATKSEGRTESALGGGAAFAAGPANVWIGLANSDDVGLRLDLRAEVLLDSVVVASGEIDDVTTGSSGFNNALLKSIPLATLATSVADGAVLGFRLSARRTCFGGGHTSGTARFWYGGAHVDTGAGRDAGSRLDITVDGATSTYDVLAFDRLYTTPGTSRVSTDLKVNSTEACPTRPFAAFGTWTDVRWVVTSCYEAGGFNHGVFIDSRGDRHFCPSTTRPFCGVTPPSAGSILYEPLPPSTSIPPADLLALLSATRKVDASTAGYTTTTGPMFHMKTWYGQLTSAGTPGHPETLIERYTDGVAYGHKTLVDHADPAAAVIRKYRCYQTQ